MSENLMTYCQRWGGGDRQTLYVYHQTVREPDEILPGGEGEGRNYLCSIHWLDDIKMQSSVMFLGKIFTALPHSTKKYK